MWPNLGFNRRYISYIISSDFARHNLQAYDEEYYNAINSPWRDVAYIAVVGGVY